MSEKKRIKISESDLTAILHALKGAYDCAQTFYPGANPMERRGMYSLMAEINQAQELCIAALRQTRKERR